MIFKLISKYGLDTNPDFNKKVHKVYKFIEKKATFEIAPTGTKCHMPHLEIWELIIKLADSKEEAVVLTELLHLNYEAIYVKTILSRSIDVIKKHVPLTPYKPLEESMILSAAAVLRTHGAPGYITDADFKLIVANELVLAQTTLDITKPGEA